MIRRLFIPVLAIVATWGCVDATISCPTSGPPMGVQINANDISVLAGELVSVAAKVAPIAAVAGKNVGATAPNSTSTPVNTLHVNTTPLYGNQNFYCGPQAPVAIATPAA